MATTRVPRWAIAPLPAAPHIPGSGTHPDHAALAGVKARCPLAVTDANWRDCPPYLHGLDLYASAYYWEAHEMWEPVWLATQPNAREHQLMVGLIQLANAALKLRMQQTNAAGRLARLALLQLGECRRADLRPLMGVDVDALIAGVQQFADQAGGRMAPLAPCIVLGE